MMDNLSTPTLTVDDAALEVARAARTLERARAHQLSVDAQWAIAAGMAEQAVLEAEAHLCALRRSYDKAHEDALHHAWAALEALEPLSSVPPVAPEDGAAAFRSAAALAVVS